MQFMQGTDARVTYAELLQWPDDGRQRELHDGEVVVVPAPFPRHQLVASNVEAVLREYANRSHGLMLHAPLDIVLTDHVVLQPDVVYFRRERRVLIKDWEATRAVPDLAVEVLSSRTEPLDRGRKMDLLARFGLPEYWLVDPAKNTLEIHLLRGGAYQCVIEVGERGSVTSPTLPGLSFAAARLFAA